MLVFVFFFTDTSTTAIYTLSLHDALPIYGFHLPDRSLYTIPNHYLFLRLYLSMRCRYLHYRPVLQIHYLIQNTPGLLSTEKDRKSTRLNSSHSQISYAVFCLKKKKKKK